MSQLIKQAPNEMIPEFTNKEFQRNPYPFYDAARSFSPVFWSAFHRIYFVLGAKALHEVIVNKRFSVDSPFRASRVLFGRTIMDVEGEEHSRLRSIVNRGFIPSEYPKYVEDYVCPIINEQLTPMVRDGGGDFISQFANHIPTRIMSHIIGIPVERYLEFFELSLPIIRYLDVSSSSNLADARQAMSRLKDIVDETLIEERNQPQNTIIGKLIKSKLAGKPINDDEIARQVGLLIPAAIDTTNRLIANTLYLLALYSDWQKILRDDHSIIPAFVEEVMRFEPPIHSSVRTCIETCKLEGVTIEKGAMLNINFAAANRDPSFFESPNIFDPKRNKVKRHFSFGGGKHQCMGRSFATVEVVEVVKAVIRAGSFYLSEPDSTFINGVAFRSPEKLLLSFK